MKEEHNLPLLLEYVFVDSDETIQDCASDRLLTWAEAFDEWLRQIARANHAGAA